MHNKVIIELTLDECEYIAQALQELPMKIAAPLLQNFKQQVMDQLHLQAKVHATINKVKQKGESNGI